MNVEETKLKGSYIIQPEIFKDKRGYLIESYNQKSLYESLNFKIHFVQDNESQSTRGVLRGLHYQIGEFAQAKLVRVVRGCVLDVAVDLRANSKTFGEHISIELSAENKKQLFIPRGFAHGFIVLEDDTIFSYKCDNFYNQKAERGIVYNDSDLNINWKLPSSDLIISDKDLALPNFKNAEL